MIPIESHFRFPSLLHCKAWQTLGLILESPSSFPFSHSPLDVNGKLCHAFAEYFKVKFRKSERSVRILILRNVTIFWIFEIPLSSISHWHEGCIDVFLPRIPTQNAWLEKVQALLMPLNKHKLWKQLLFIMLLVLFLFRVKWVYE